MLSELKQEFKQQFYNKYFLFYLASIIFVCVSWFALNIVTLRIFGIIILVICQFFYNRKVKINDDLFIRCLHWAYFLFFLLLSVTYVAVSVKEMEISLLTLIILPIPIIISILIPIISDLWNPKNLFGLIFSYIFLAFLLIVLFGYGFVILGLSQDNAVKWVSDDKALDGTWDFIYFSAQNFYSNSLGDIIPLGMSRVWAVIEFITGTVIHVILLGMIISRLNNMIKARKK